MVSSTVIAVVRRSSFRDQFSSTVAAKQFNWVLQYAEIDNAKLQIYMYSEFHPLNVLHSFVDECHGIASMRF
jgi:hypothetical protein